MKIINNVYPIYIVAQSPSLGGESRIKQLTLITQYSVIIE